MAPEIQGAEREALSVWFKDQLNTVQRDYEDRIKVLRTVGEHPSPVFADMVRNFGATGLSKAATARMMNVSVTTITTHYASDYELGQAQMVNLVGKNYVRIGLSQDPFMVATTAKVAGTILEKFGGQDWKPATKRLEVEDTTKNQPPLMDTSNMSAADRQIIREVLERQLLAQQQQAADGDDIVDGDRE